MSTFSNMTYKDVKGKGKFHTRTGNEGPETEYRYSFTLSLTSALGGRGWLTPRPDCFTPGKDTRYTLRRRLDGPRDGVHECRKISTLPGFLCVLLYSVLHSYLVLCPDCPAFCLLSLLTTHSTNINHPGGIQTRNPSKRSAVDPPLKPLGHWDRRD